MHYCENSGRAVGVLDTPTQPLQSLRPMDFDNGPLTLALAMFVGVMAQVTARHLRIPGVVLLLALGVGLGPDGADYIRPAAMGGGLSAVVGFAIAIILFEGGLSLQLPVLRKQGKPIVRLVTLGALVTGILAALAALVIMPWDYRLSILFGTLVIVTGPTVVTPIVRRLRLSSKLTSILIAEGIFIDAVGATIAVVALEIVVASQHGATAALSIVLRIGGGAVVGLVGGGLLVGLLKVRRLVPHGLENVLVLAAVVATYHISDSLVGESGITAAIVVGMVVGNAGIRLHDHVLEFNEELTALLVATLFVLLAADVRIADVLALGGRGIILAAVLMFVVRPATVFGSTFGTDLTRPEKAYLSWLAPRGIVAAAVASLFALELAEHGISGGTEMRAMVFVVIASTVTIQGLTAAFVGDKLKVRKPERTGYIILGANPLARLIGRAFIWLGEPVVFVERAEDTVRSARAQGLEVVHGDGLDSQVLESAGIDGVAHAVGLTANEHVNFLFARTIAEELRGPALALVLERIDSGVTPAMVDRHDMRILFGSEHDLLLWLDRAHRGEVAVQRFRLELPPEGAVSLSKAPGEMMLPLCRVRDREALPYTETTSLRRGDDVVILVATTESGNVDAWLEANGWLPGDSMPL